MSDETPASKKRTRRNPPAGAPEEPTPGVGAAAPPDVPARVDPDALARAEVLAHEEALVEASSAASQPAGGEPVAAGDRPAVSGLRIERGGVDTATAETVEVRLGGIGRLTAEEVFV